jgi:hypothetical protein
MRSQKEERAGGHIMVPWGHEATDNEKNGEINSYPFILPVMGVPQILHRAPRESWCQKRSAADR